MTPLCRVQPNQISLYNKTVCWIIGEDIRKKLVAQWHRCATNFVDYLRELEAIFEKALTCVSGTQGKLFDE
jgi:hypothetical protein